MTTPNGSTPDGSLATGEFAAWQAMTEEDAKAKMRAPVSAFGNAQTGFKGWIGALLSGFANLAEGIGDVIGNIVGALTGGLHFTLGGLSTYSSEQAASQLDIQTRTQALEGVIGFGAVTMPSDYVYFGNLAVLPQTSQIGPMVGVTIHPQGGLIFGSKGLWKIEGQAWFRSTGYTGNGDCYTYLDVLDTNGNLVSTKRARIDHDAHDGSITNVHTFVVPTAGYRIRLAVSSGRWRNLAGGGDSNTLTATKMSSETS